MKILHIMITLLAIIMFNAVLTSPGKAAMSDSEFFSLVDTGNLSKVQDAIKAGANVNAKDDWGETPLHIAAASMFINSEVVRALINAGANVNARNNYGLTPLTTLWQPGFESQSKPEERIAVLNILVSAGADVNARDTDGRTVLMNAVESFGTSVVNALINAGADVNARDNNGKTPLMYISSCSYGSIDEINSVVSILTKAGADLNAKDSNGKSAQSFVNERQSQGCMAG
ncbi:MAG: ankyrin repeat domain-containing protein [Deltaproteobacteria bacterium]|jgi:ankyrin repeat protein|nr:ankyrin repeat domain-containing protein [Deltaproteobacteria bacterium]